MGTGSQTGLGTGGIHSGIRYSGTDVVGGIRVIGYVAILTISTGIGGVTVCGTGGSGHDRLVIMADRIDHFLLNQFGVTDRAVRTGSQTGSLTSGCHSGIDNHGMTQRIHVVGHITVVTSAVRTGIGRVTGISTSGRSDHKIVAMAGGRIQAAAFTLSSQPNRDVLDLAADAAVYISEIHTAVGAIPVCLMAGNGTRGFDLIGPGQRIMSGGRNHFLSLQDCVADGAVLALGQTAGSTGSRHSSINNLGVSQLFRNSLLHSDLAADRALLALG